MEFNLMTVVKTVAPSFESIDSEVKFMKSKYSHLNNDKIAEKFCENVITKYASIGVTTALPSIIPGLGTAAQIATEAGTIAGDLAMMLRYMATITYGTAKIYGKENIGEFDQEFILTLGQWCGAIIPMKEATKRVGVKVAMAQFNKNISGKLLSRINSRVGTTLLTKYGTKRGGIALGRLVPFGIGAAVGGTFNYVTMKGFKKAAIARYNGTNDNVEYVIID